MSANLYDLDGKVFLITGGAGLLGLQHAKAIADANGIPVLLDIANKERKGPSDKIENLSYVFCDVTSEHTILSANEEILSKFGHIDGLINNAANNQKMEAGDVISGTRLEEMSLDEWNKDIAISLTGAMLCSKIFGGWMASHNGGVIINISSDLGIIAPDQRIYAKDGVPDDQQVVKPVSYSVIKHGIIGLTKYLSTYWPDKAVRANALCPGGIYSGQPDELVEKLTSRIPLGRMATETEYHGAIQFLCSDASKYMNGSILTIDGGRTCW
jgi:NAD(P)-dependent dehydrogenase (short-subunit alcohol dehydrogenase family)